jgi:hypothetical protein
MNLKNKLNVITNISIIITFIFTIVLIVDEIYNMGIFAMNYTYNYNYGTFHSNFNNIQTIEYETNRYNVYNNIDFLYKDIFNKSYFNFLMKVAITFITVLFAIAYGLYYHQTFIIDMPLICNFETADTFIKKALKCLCDNCHKIIPNCTTNFFISFILIIVIPFSYLIKSLFVNIDFTPSSDTTLFSLIYIIIFILLLSKYIYELYTNNLNEKNEKIKVVISYFIATIVLIISGYIYKYIYKKYNNNPSLNSKKDITIFNDMYKQTPPIKPTPAVKPDFLPDFTYDSKNTSPDYKHKKEIVDNYYSAVKTYENELKYYNQRYENYKNSITPILGDNINFINIFLNMTGLNNNLHQIIIGLIIFIAVYYYYFHKDDIIYMCMIYMISIIIVLTIINAIQYYNTYVNKYIIYEPSAQYKSDIETVNTKLNLLIDPTNGENFFNYLTNTKDISADIDNNDYTLNDKFLNLKIRNLIANELIENINTDTNNPLKDISDKLSSVAIIDNNIIPYENYTIYIKADSTPPNFQSDFYAKIKTLKRLNVYRFPIEFLYLHFNNNIKYKITPAILKIHNILIYFKAYQLFKLLEKLETLNYRNIIKLKEKYYTILYDIKNNYFTNEIGKLYTEVITNIDNDINTITKTPSIDNNNNLINEYDKFFKEVLNTITPANYVDATAANTKIIINKIKITTNSIDFTDATTIFYTDSTKIISTTITKITSNTIVENNDFKHTIIYNTQKLYELPYKITDNMNNEYYISSSEITPNKLIIQTTNISYKILKINFKYDDTISNRITYAYDSTNNIYSNTDDSSTNIQYPFNLMYNNDISNDNDKNILINIVLRALDYNFGWIISSFETTNLCGIYNKDTTDCSKIRIGTRYYTVDNTGTIDQKYSGYFNFFNITDNSAIPNYKLTSTLNNNYFKNIDATTEAIAATSTSTAKSAITTIDYTPFIIFLYNIYNYDENRINDIIEYCIYLYYDNQTKINNYSDPILSTDLNKIKFKINKTKENNLIDKYLKNIYIIKFIIKLYSIFIKSNKYLLETKFDTSLCMPGNSNKFQKETKIYDIIFKYFNSTTISSITTTYSAKKTSSSASASDVLTAAQKLIISQISKNCIYFFNICIYLFKYNMDKATDLSLDGMMNSIITNYKFYNPDDIDEIKLEELRKEVSINCNYYNKYNDIDKKQLSIIKTNADAVSFNFPILAVIFLIFLGEPLFIKS